MFSESLFVIEIFIAEYLFTMNLRRRKLYILRIFLSVAVCFAVAFVMPSFSNAWYSCFMYLTLFAATILSLKFIYEETWVNVIFCGIAAYTAQHFAHQFSNLVCSLILWGRSPLLDLYYENTIDISALNVESLFWIFVSIVCYFTVYGFVYFMFGRRIKKNEALEIKNRSLLILLGVCLFINIILNAILVYEGETEDVVYSVICAVYICFSCFLLLQWQFELVHSKILQTELDMTRQILQQEKEQYKLSKENIDFINLKCHDMKHQIREIGMIKSLGEETIREVENAISIYDSVLKTGNEALDTILTEKSLKCLKHNIILSCIADGEKLNFMKDSDVYSLFGNALDNAIEAVMKLEDKSLRVIGLKISSAGKIITVNIKNFFDGVLSLDSDGLPCTTKKDRNFHGFGMKSIRLIVEKYDGNVSVQQNGNVFNLNMLIPIREG